MLLHPPKQIRRHSGKANYGTVSEAKASISGDIDAQSRQAWSPTRSLLLGHVEEARFHRSENDSLQSEDVLNFLRNASASDRLTRLSCEEVLTDASMKAIEEVFKNDHQRVRLKSLRLSNNHLTSVAAESLASILLILRGTLEELDISCNRISEKGVAILIQPLLEQGEGKSSLIALDLGGNNLKKKAARHLAELLRRNKTLREVGLGRNKDLAADLKKIVHALLENKETKLARLDLQGNCLGARASAIKLLTEMLFKNETISSLDLSSNSLGRQGAIGVASALNYRNQLHDLNLGRNDIGPGGVTGIANVLNEGGTIQGYCHLKRLTLDWNQIGDDGCIYLAICLEKNSTLSYLDLSKNHIGSPGALQLSKTFSINFCLREVLLDENVIDDEGALALAQSLSGRDCSVQKLSCRGNPRITDRGRFFLVHAFQHRQSIRTWLYELQKDLQADRLMSVNWWTLPSDDNVITDWEVKVLALALSKSKPQMLQSVWLMGEYITADSMQEICEKYLAGNQTLQRLYLKAVALGPSINDIARALCTSTLRILSITDCGLVGIEGATSLAVALKQSWTLQRINLQGNAIGDEGFQAVWEVIHPLNIASSNHPSLVALNVANNGLTDQSTAFISASGSLDPLEELNLDSNCFTDFSCLDLAKSILLSSSLKILHMSKNESITYKGKQTLRLFAPPRCSC